MNYSKQINYEHTKLGWQVHIKFAGENVNESRSRFFSDPRSAERWAERQSPMTEHWSVRTVTDGGRYGA